MTRLGYYRTFIAYLAVVGAFLLYIGLAGFFTHDRWIMGDWITNYAGGFVRRGLTGQVALDLSHLPLHLSLYFWAFVLELLCYAAIFGAILYLLRGLAWSFWMVLLVYSPATLSFTLFDPTIAFRKEILFLALLGIVIVALSSSRLSLSSLSAFLVFAMVALVLSHEGMFFFYPYIVCAFLVARRSAPSALLAAAPGALAGALAFFFAFQHPGSLATVNSICASLGGTELSYEPCSGAIVYLTKTTASAHQDVLGSIRYWHLKMVLPFLLFMALAPVIFGMSKLRGVVRLRFGWWSLVLCSAAAWITTLPLFIYATDWTRWIYIHVFSCLMLMLMMERQRQAGQLNSAEQVPILPAREPARAIAVLLLCISAFGWQLSFYHHFPLPGDRVGTYFRDRLQGRPLHHKLDWTPVDSPTH